MSSQNIGELVALTAANFIQINDEESRQEAPDQVTVRIEVRTHPGRGGLIAKQETLFVARANKEAK